MVRCVLHGAFYLKIIRSPYDLEDISSLGATSFKLTVFKTLKWTLYRLNRSASVHENCFTV